PTSCPVLSIFTPPAPTQLSTLSLHDALPISSIDVPGTASAAGAWDLYHSIKRSVSSVEMYAPCTRNGSLFPGGKNNMSPLPSSVDRKSTRLNSSHVSISYAVFCLKKKRHRWR